MAKHETLTFHLLFDEAIIPHRLGDEGLDCLYGTKNTFLIMRRLLRDKIHWKSCGKIPHGEPTMLRIWTHLINWRRLWGRAMCSTQTPRLGGSDEAIILHRLRDEGFGCLYGTKNTSLIARRLLRDKTHWKPYETIPRGELTMLQI